LAPLPVERGEVQYRVKSMREADVAARHLRVCLMRNKELETIQKSVGIS
jgi:hypothetical protein